MTIREITVHDLDEHLRSGGVAFDVREVDEYVEVHAIGVTLVPLSGLADQIDTFRSAPSGTPIICRSGARSMRACEFLAGHGIESVNVMGGTMGWAAAGLPVESGDPAA